MTWKDAEDKIAVVQAFLNDLTTLTHAYGIVIDVENRGCEVGGVLIARPADAWETPPGYFWMLDNWSLSFGEGHYASQETIMPKKTAF